MLTHKASYTKKSKQLLACQKSDAIKIDFLAFTFPLANLRHLKTRGSANLSTKIKTGTKKCFFTGIETDVYQETKLSCIFPEMPAQKSFVSGELEDYEKYKLKSAEILGDFYLETLKIFVEHLFKMEVSPMRGRGLHGYRDSMTLRANGVDVGFIGIGGQRDTVFFQISGTGCKHLWSVTTSFIIHHWLSKVLSVYKLSRIDLAYDCYDNNFNCNYAELAYKDGAFSSGAGGRPPEFGDHDKYTYDKNMNKVFTVEMKSIGKRTSPVYWRIYNKKLEQGIKHESFTWYRSEVELKKWDIDCLLNPAATFAGICPFSASLDLDKGIKTKSMTKAKDACLELASRAKHIRRSCGKALNDILEVFDGDLSKAFGLIMPEQNGSKYGLPPTYKHLINQVIEV